MKTKLLIITPLFIFFCSLSFGQTYSKKIMDKTKRRQETKFSILKKDNKTTFNNLSEYQNNLLSNKREFAPIGVPGDIRFRTASLPISFSRLETDSSGNWKIGSAISLGGSYIWGWGNGTLNPDSSITTDPKFFFGLTGNFGVVQDKNNLAKLVPSLTLGGILGFSSFAVMFGADLLNKTPIVGISYNISGFPLLKNLTYFYDYPTKKIGK